MIQIFSPSKGLKLAEHNFNIINLLDTHVSNEITTPTQELHESTSSSVCFISCLNKKSVDLLCVGYLRTCFLSECNVSINPTDVGTILSKHVASGTMTVQFHCDQNKAMDASFKHLESLGLESICDDLIMQLDSEASNAQALLAYAKIMGKEISMQALVGHGRFKDHHINYQNKDEKEERWKYIIETQKKAVALQQTALDMQGHCKPEIVLIKTEHHLSSQVLTLNLTKVDCESNDKIDRQFAFGVFCVSKNDVVKFEMIASHLNQVVDDDSSVVQYIGHLRKRCKDKVDIDMRFALQRVTDSEDSSSVSPCMNVGDCLQVFLNRKDQDGTGANVKMMLNGNELLVEKYPQAASLEENQSWQRKLSLDSQLYYILQSVSCNCLDRQGYEFEISVH